MKRRIFALAIACALSLSLLTACGGDSSSAPEDGSGSGSSTSQDGSSSTPDQSQPDQSAGGSASLPDEGDASAEGDGSASASGSQSQPDEGGEAQGSQFALNRTDFTLFSAGSTFQLKVSSDPTGGTRTWTSSDESVATVSDNGTVTAVAPGTATVTVTDSKSGQTASCTVRCNWEETAQEPETPDESETPDEPEQPAAEGVDLQAFFDTINTAYEMPFMMAVDSSLLDSTYAGLTGIATEQLVVYQCGMSPSPAGDVALVQVSDSADVDAVKAIFQARIDYMVEGGAWYPGPTEMWQNSSRIVSNGNYVMLVVNENCDAIVNDFNALF